MIRAAAEADAAAAFADLRALHPGRTEKSPQIVENPGVFPVPWLSIVQNVEMFFNILDNLSLS